MQILNSGIFITIVDAIRSDSCEIETFFAQNESFNLLRPRNFSPSKLVNQIFASINLV